MKFLVSLLIFTVTFASLVSNANLKEREKAFINTVNLLKNPGFESGIGKWSKTGTSTLAKDVTTPLYGFGSADWDAGATGEFLKTELVTPSRGMSAQRCEALIDYRWVGSAGDIQFEVRDELDGTIATIDLAVTAGTDTQQAQLLFDCLDPATKQMRIVLESTADAASIKVDRAYLGIATGVAQVTQAELVAYAYYPRTGGCVWQRDNVAMGAFNLDTDCPAISVTHETQTVNTTDDDLPNIVFDELKAGTYEIIAMAGVGHSQTGSVSRSVRISDGVNIGRPCGTRKASLSDGTSRDHVVCSMVKTFSTSGPQTFFMQGQESAPGSIQLLNGTEDTELTWIVKKYPTSPAEAVTLTTVGEHWDVNIGGGNPNLGTANQAALIPIEDAGLDMVINTGSKSAEIPCSNTFASTGLTCSGGAEGIGIVVDVSTAGRYKVCGEYTHFMDHTAATNAAVIFEWIETPNSSLTILQQGNSRIQSGGVWGANEGATQSLHVCGQFVFTTAGQKTLRLMYEQSMGLMSTNALVADRGAGLGARDIHITVDKMDQQMPTPVFTDLQADLDTKLEVGAPGVFTGPPIYKAISCLTSASPAIVRNPYNDGGSVVTSGGAGTCLWTFGTAFTGDIICTVSADNTTANRNCQTTAVSASAVTMRSRDPSTGTLIADICNIICVGK